MADYGNAAVGHETPVLVAWFDAYETALIGRKRYLSLSTDSGHELLQLCRSTIRVSVVSLYLQQNTNIANASSSSPYSSGLSSVSFMTGSVSLSV